MKVTTQDLVGPTKSMPKEGSQHSPAVPAHHAHHSTACNSQVTKSARGHRHLERIGVLTRCSA